MEVSYLYIDYDMFLVEMKIRLNQIKYVRYDTRMEREPCFFMKTENSEVK